MVNAPQNRHKNMQEGEWEENDWLWKGLGNNKLSQDNAGFRSLRLPGSYSRHDKRRCRFNKEKNSNIKHQH